MEKRIYVINLENPLEDISSEDRAKFMVSITTRFGDQVVFLDPPNIDIRSFTVSCTESVVKDIKEIPGVGGVEPVMLFEPQVENIISYLQLKKERE